MLRCMVRYSDRAFYKDLDAWFCEHLTTPMKVKDIEGVDKLFNRLVVRLSAEAAAGSRIARKYSFGNESYGSQTVHMATQCTPDI